MPRAAPKAGLLRPAADVQPGGVGEEDHHEGRLQEQDQQLVIRRQVDDPEQGPATNPAAAKKIGAVTIVEASRLERRAYARTARATNTSGLTNASLLSRRHRGSASPCARGARRLREQVEAGGPGLGAVHGG